MKIGFDLDRVFINTPPFIPNAIISRIYMKRRSATELEYRIPKPNEQVIRIISHHPMFRPPIKKNLAFLKELSATEHQLYLISSRYGFLRRITERLVKKYKLDKTFSELFFNYENRQAHIYKSGIINRLNLDIYLDDDLPLLKYVAGRNNRVKLFWLNNKLNKKLGPNITAITDIRQILQ